jgi:hypothetical protein
MSIGSRETYYAALFTLVSGAASFHTASRRVRHWSDVQASEQPALFLAVGPQTPQQVRNLPPKWMLDAKLYVYAHADGNLDPGPILNNLIDAVEAALQPSVNKVTQDLGGLVSHAWIEGVVETDEGTLGEQAVAVIPIRMLVA